MTPDNYNGRWSALITSMTKNALGETMYCRVFKYLCLWALALFSSVVLADEAGRVRGAPDWLIDGVIYQINMRSFAPHGQRPNVFPPWQSWG